MLIQTVGCVLQEVVLDENGKEVKSSFRDEAEEYLKQKTTERKQEADKIKAEYLAKKQAEKAEAKKTKKFRR